MNPEKKYQLALIVLCFVLLLPFAYVSSENKSKHSTPTIKLNQLGYQPDAQKLAIVNGSASGTFTIQRTTDQQIVYSGDLSNHAIWPFSKESVQKADFSTLRTPGEYQIIITGVANSHPFVIADNLYKDVHDAALKSYYFNRASTALEKQYAGEFARAAGHPDTDVIVHKSAATKQRPEGTRLSSPKGWYDAGDYGKYVVNSGISTYTLLAAYLDFSDFYQSNQLNIPESSDQVPDIINEIMWNLEWLSTMQDLDGGVYHKLTSANFHALDKMPQEADSKRYVIGKSVTATLNFVAVMSTASRVISDFDTHFPGLSEKYEKQALKAWAWAKEHPQELYKQPSGINTGAYKDNSASDEFSWAAAELFLLTGEQKYMQDFIDNKPDPTLNPNWSNVDALGFISLVRDGEKLLSDQQYDSIKEQLIEAAETYYRLYMNSAYAVAADRSDFVWGSNSSLLNRGIMLMQAYRYTQQDRYKNAAIASLDYVFGRNATGYSFVTGYGDFSSQHIHHRPSVADSIGKPIPGFIVGGPHAGRQDKCNYSGNAPATTYLDHPCSYATNEIAINWNAPLVYMLAAASSE